MKAPVTPLFYSIPDAGARLSLSRTTIYVLIRRGDLPVVHEGRRALIPATALDAYAERLVHGSIDRLKQRGWRPDPQKSRSR